MKAQHGLAEHSHGAGVTTNGHGGSSLHKLASFDVEAHPVPRGRDPVFRTRPVSVIRKGDWKLHLYHEEWQLDGRRAKLDSNNAAELYNIVQDPGETKNQAASEREKRDELLDDLLAWIERVPAPLPSEPNPQWKPSVGKPKLTDKE